jgi:hypothetical protein
VHDAAFGKLKIFRVAQDRFTESARIFHGAAHHFRAADGSAVVGKSDSASLN